MPSVTLEDTWDCHVHCFEPDRFPYKSTRAYTPQPAPLQMLLQSLLTTNCMLVQATIEKGFEGLLARLEECRHGLHGCSGLMRGTVLADAETSLFTISDDELLRMHNLGVRCIRLHGSYGGSGHDATWVQGQFEALAHSKPVQRYGWSISAQLPLQTWSQLKPFILTNTSLATVRIVADHNACAVPSDYGSSALEDFAELLSSGRVYVKISALHRRSSHGIHAMEPIISLFANTAPQALLWGSDWPHVDTSQNGHEAGPLEGVQATTELSTVQSWLSLEQRRQMLIENPGRLFGI